jgi:hypothetical protein
MSPRCNTGDLALLLRNVPGCLSGAGRLALVEGPAILDDELGWVWPIIPITTSEWIYEDGIRPVQLLDRPHWLQQPDAWMVRLDVPSHAVWYEGTGATSGNMRIRPVRGFAHRLRLKYPDSRLPRRRAR